MFSENGQISIRQSYRLLLFDLIGVGTLILPAMLAEKCGSAGIWCVVLGSTFAYAYLWILCKAIERMKTDLLSYMRKYKWLIAILGLNAIAMAGLCGYIFTDLVRRELVPQESYELILALILVVSAYAVMGGMESRARVYEVLFWFVIIPLLIMLLVAMKDIKTDYFTDVIEISSANKMLNVLSGSYYVFISFTTLFYIMMFPAFVAPKNIKHLKKAGAIALFGASGILLLTYIVLVGCFGGNALSNMKYPAVTLMSTVKIEGSFLKRTDAFMLGIWFFTLYALLNINLFYGAKKLEKIVGKVKKKRYVVAVTLLVYLVGIYFEYGDGVMEKYIKFLRLVGVPILVFIPIVILMTGCNSLELEDRCFPMLSAVDMNEKEVEFSYIFPKLELGEKKEQQKLYDNNGGKGMEFVDARSECESNLVKKADPNHLKILLLGDDFYRDNDKMVKMLKSLQEDESFPRNAYVCTSDDVEEITDMNEEISEDIGTYLEQLLEKKQQEQGLFLVTIGDIIDENDNDMIDYEIPHVSVVDGEICIDTTK